MKLVHKVVIKQINYRGVTNMVFNVCVLIYSSNYVFFCSNKGIQFWQSFSITFSVVVLNAHYFAYNFCSADL
jgi:hypothetical protein